MKNWEYEIVVLKEDIWGQKLLDLAMSYGEMTTIEVNRKFLLENQEEIPDEWKKYEIIIPGSIIQQWDGVTPLMVYSNGKWGSARTWFDYTFGRGYAILVKKQTR